MGKWTEENQKAEFIGGAITLGCFVIPIGVIVLMFILFALFG